MGATISTLIYQPLLLSTAVVLMIIALVYQYRSCNTGGKSTDNWGQEIFKLDVGLAIVLIIIAVIINFMSGFTI